MVLLTTGSRRIATLLLGFPALGLGLPVGCLPEIDAVVGDGSGGDAGSANTGGGGSTGGSGPFECETAMDGEYESCCEGNDDCHSAICRPNHICDKSAMDGPCVDDQDCWGLNCDLSVTPTVCGPGHPSTDCGRSEDCLSGSCNVPAALCLPGDLNTPCLVDSDCALENCDTGLCAKAHAGGDCNEDSLGGDADCLSDLCVGGVCTLGEEDDLCTADGDCMSATCTDTEPRTCAAPSLVVITQQSGSNPNDATLDVQFSIENAGPAVSMADLTFLYFFKPTNTSMEAEPPVALGVLTGLTLDQQVFSVSSLPSIWAFRVQFTSDTTLDTDGTTGMLHLRASYTAGNPDVQGDDYSWPVDPADFGGLARANPLTVLCLREGTDWRQVWGNPPPSYPDPCGAL